MDFKGKAHKFGNDVNTDYIISGKYKFKTLDMKELSKHAMEDLDPEFSQKVAKGDLLVAGSNFGCGSSREQAPWALLYTGLSAVIAKSFARLFYRNAINCGLPLVECDTDRINPGDELEVDLAAGVIHNLTSGEDVKITPLPGVMIKILQDGGLAAHFQKYGGFNFD